MFSEEIWIQKKIVSEKTKLNALKDSVKMSHFKHAFELGMNKMIVKDWREKNPLKSRRILLSDCATGV